MINETKRYSTDFVNYNAQSINAHYQPKLFLRKKGALITIINVRPIAKSVDHVARGKDCGFITGHIAHFFDFFIIRIPRSVIVEVIRTGGIFFLLSFLSTSLFFLQFLPSAPLLVIKKSLDEKNAL